MPYFAQPSPDLTSIWAAVYEKVLAKVKGNYMNAGSDTLTESIGYLTGIPVFSYTPT